MNRILTAAVGAIILARPAFAHTSVGATSGFAAGFMHPLTGLDHILAMAGVGVLAVQGGRAALWALPLAFLAIMGLGAGLALTGVALPLVEPGVAGSVLVLGAAIALGERMPAALGAGLVGALALFHGYAHGTEMTPGLSAAGYGLGFLAATALLIAAGGVLAKAGRATAPRLERLAGLALVAAGIGLAV